MKKTTVVLKISMLCVFTGMVPVFSQTPHASITSIERPVDFESLSAPDSLGNRHLLKLPSAKRASAIKIVYPVIFVHGLNSGAYTWDSITGQLDAKYGFSYG